MNSQSVNSHPVQVLNHSYKHGYKDLANTAAYNSLAQPLISIINGLTTPGLLARWVKLPSPFALYPLISDKRYEQLRYYNYWHDIVLYADKMIASADSSCPARPSVQAAYLHSVTTNIQLLSTLPSHSTISPCKMSGLRKACACIPADFQSKIRSKVVKIPNFSDITE